MRTIKRKNGFIFQAGLLACAGIIVRIIGILYRSPLTKIITDEGNGYFSTAYNIYTMVLLISSYSIPMAVSKVISARLALKQYKNAHRIFLCSLLYATIIGGCGSIFTFFAAPYLVNSHSALALRVLSPTIFLSGILGVFRGYFQAQNTMVETSISQIVEQILNAIVSVVAAYALTRPFVGVLDNSLIPIYGAAGGALGTGAGVLIGLLYMLHVYFSHKPERDKHIQKEKNSQEEPYTEIFKIIILMVTPVIFSTFIYNFVPTLDMSIFYNIMSQQGMSEEKAATLYGVFSGKYMVLINVPIALASAASTALVPGISGYYATGNLSYANAKVREATRFTMLISIPASIGMIALAKPIMWLLFPQKATIDLAANLLRLGSISVIFYAMSTLSNGVLQGIGKMGAPARNATIALLVQVIPLYCLLAFTNLGIYSLVIATILYSLLMCILNGLSVRKYLPYKQEVKKTFVIPLVSSGIMGVAAYFSYQFIYASIKSNSISLVVSILTGILIYFILIIRWKGILENELRDLPQGEFLVKVLKKIHLI